MAQKLGNICSICRAEFASSGEHMVHVSTAHPAGTPAPRPFSCWRCASECDPHTGICPRCGWHHPHYPSQTQGEIEMTMKSELPDVESMTKKALLAELRALASPGHNGHTLAELRIRVSAVRAALADKVNPISTPVEIPKPPANQMIGHLDPAYYGPEAQARLQEQIAARIEADNATNVQDERATRLTAATAERQAVKTWEKAGRVGEKPATPNLDAINAHEPVKARKPANGRKTAAKSSKGRNPRKSAGPTRRAHSERHQLMLDTKKRIVKRGPGRKMSWEELVAYVAGVQALPGADFNTEREYAYWVEGISIGRDTWAKAWAAASNLTAVSS